MNEFMMDIGKITIAVLALFGLAVIIVSVMRGLDS